jgi:hypothetical protein
MPETFLAQIVFTAMIFAPLTLIFVNGITEQCVTIITIFKLADVL